MFSTENGRHSEGIEEANGGHKSKVQSPLHCSNSINGLLPRNEIKRSSSKIWSMGTPTAKFWKIALQKDEISRSTTPSASNHHIRERLKGIFSKKIDWDSLKHEIKEWFRNPLNIALFIWITIVAVSGAILFLVMTGMLNSAIPKKSERNTWFEVNNQILNALFTLMCLYQHPKRFHHLVMLVRWKPEDISRLRKIYCKNGTYKPHEWAHMMVVVVLLHVNCFAQYALCALNLGYRRSNRPAIGVAVCISVAIAAPAIAGVYTIISPLGKEYHFDEGDEESQVHMTAEENSQLERKKLRSSETRMSFVMRGDRENVEIENPTWQGGILDFWNDISVAYFSFFCTFCVFGWNMERLGFGNMYVHIATFVLFCSAPYFIFSFAAVNIDSDTVRAALVLTGFIFCALGLFYGGYWRIQMRKRYKLPGYNFCFGKPVVADCLLWLCCCWCSLAQEVRTADSYDIVVKKLDKERSNGNIEMLTSTLENRVNLDGSGPSSTTNAPRSSPMMMNSGPATTSTLNSSDPGIAVESQNTRENWFSSTQQDERVENTMTPPTPLSIKRENC